ncbi:hypothetical protein ACFSKU_09965 [Pontibacter silvestris]|uniref:DUF1795 domain-containing protein n=1 Tax=Pontibacter silvestris TaxID=2305183 RepID=A0ABW4WWZ9_9BACT|nr:hypothetical protein [Pontibacter silvestris]MCC9136836.1 hypothetical protein [Pontibacter silvestris]
MNIRYLAFLAIIFVAGVVLAAPKLKKVQISKEISVKLPQDFSPQSDDDVARKFPATTRPLAVYSSPNDQIDFSVTQKSTPFKSQDLKMLQEFYKANLVETFTKVDFIREEVTQVNGKDFIVFEFVSNLADERGASILGPVQKYSMVQYTIQGNQLLIFTMHTPFTMKNEWQPTVREVMNSINIK